MAKTLKTNIINNCFYTLLLTLSMSSAMRSAALPVYQEELMASAEVTAAPKYNDAATRELYEAVIKHPGEGDDTLKNVEKDVIAVKQALAKGANPNAQLGDKKYTLLQEAFMRRWPKLNVIKALLQAGADPSIKDYKGRDAITLLIDIYHSTWDQQKFILAKADSTLINQMAPDELRRYLFFSASADVLETLEDAQKKQLAAIAGETKSKSEVDALKYNDEATRELYAAVIKRPGEDDAALVDVENDAAAVEQALAKGANPNAQIGSEKYTLLQRAIMESWPKLSVIKLLLQAGADPSIKDYKSRDAITWAKQQFSELMHSDRRFPLIKSGVYSISRLVSPEQVRYYHKYLVAVDIIKVLEDAMRMQAKSRKRKSEIAKQASAHILSPLAQVVAGYLGDYADISESDEVTKKVSSRPT